MEDHVIKNIIIKKLVNKYKIDPAEIDEAELLEDSEMIKISLSENDQHSYKYKNKNPIIITRSDFENDSQTQKLIKSAVKTAKDAMQTNDKFKSSNIRMILMIGGSSNIPIIQTKLAQTFSRKTLNVQFPEFDPQLMVITGSAVLAGSMIYDNKCTVTDVIPLPLGFEVCYGAYTGEDDNCGNMDIIVQKNTQYPLEVNKTYCQHDPNGIWVRLKLYEGENPKVVDNHFISKLDVMNLIPRDPSVCESYHAVFKIDKNGIVTIHGVAHKEDGSDGDVYTMTLSLTTEDGSLSKAQLTQMKSELESWFATGSGTRFKEEL